MEQGILQSIAISAMLGALGVFLGRLLKAPPLLFFMGLGILAGPTAFGLIKTKALESVMMPFIEIAVAIIIFEAGLSLPMAGWKKIPSSIRRIITLAFPLTVVLSAVLVKYLLDFPWPTAIFFGATIVVTGPTVIGPLLRSVAMSQRVDHLFRWEAVWGDCIAVVLSGVVLETIQAPQLSDGLTLGLAVLYRVAIGALIGLFAGFVLGRWLVPLTVRLGDPGLPGILVLSSAIGLFFISNLIAHSSGVVAVATAGIVFARHQCAELDDIKHFKDQITHMIVAFLFVFLSAQLDLRTIGNDWWMMLVTAALLSFMVRPISVVLGLAWTEIPLRERFFIGFMGPRGIIAAAVISYFGIVVKDESLMADELLLLAFTTIFLSGAFVSLSGKPLAKLFRASLPSSKTGILIIGYNLFVRMFAKRLQEKTEVAIIDTNPTNCMLAKEEGIPSFCRTALSGDLYEEFMEQGYRRILIMTTNPALNSLIAAKAQVYVGQDNIYLTAPGDKEPAPSIRKRFHTLLAFSEESINITTTERMLQNKKASIEVIDNENPPDYQYIIPLAGHTKDGGIKITRAKDDTPQGKTVCLLWSQSKNVKAHPLEDYTPMQDM